MWFLVTTNYVHYVLAESCWRAHLGVQVDVGSNVTRNHNHTRPADLLVPNWVLGKPAVLNLSITSLLNPTIILEASVTTGPAAQTNEQRKHCSNDAKCDELTVLGLCTLVVNLMELGERRHWSLYLQASFIFSHLNCSSKAKSVVLTVNYGLCELM